jgi:fatty-acyl-CoA synthase
MQDYPLTLHHVFWRIERLFGEREIVTRREAGVHRYTNADLAKRVYRLANALRRMGVRPGDRVGTLAWNNYRHLELYYAVPLLGAVLHTLNMRLFTDQLSSWIRDAEDRFLFADATGPARQTGLGADGREDRGPGRRWGVCASASTATAGLRATAGA